jgi:membrane-associated phospholipid phosphatase
MSSAVGARGAANYCRQLAIVAVGLLAQLVRTPSHSRRAVAARRLVRQAAWLVAGGGVAIVVLMLAVDVPVISMMPPRGTPELWPVRMFTDFAKSGYVLSALGAALAIVLAIVPALTGARRARLAALQIRIAFVWLAVAVPNLVGELIKGMLGRGRPFVGGSANAFNFSPLAWREPFASLPSAHAITAVALAFAVAALWPRTRYAMAAYALLIGASRTVLLAHHPSDVVAGALLGVVGAMVVRQWFAVRRLGFVIRDDGRIDPLSGPST